MTEINLTKLLSACPPRQKLQLRNGETAYLVFNSNNPDTKYPYGTSYSPDGEVNCWHSPDGKCALTELPKWDITDILPPFLNIPTK